MNSAVPELAADVTCRGNCGVVVPMPIPTPLSKMSEFPPVVALVNLMWKLVVPLMLAEPDSL